MILRRSGLVSARLGAALVGVALAALLALAGPVRAADDEGHEAPQPPRESWSFAGVFGKFDRAQLQRGFKVYREVCQACHVDRIAFRTLAQNGGPEFSVAQVTALAAEYKIQDGPNDAGEMFERPGRPADYIPWTFANENAAAAAMGKAPPQLQVMAKARGFERGFPWFVFDALPFIQYQEHGVDYIHAILTGYEDPPESFKVPDGGNYNKYFPGHVIAMPKPLAQDGQVEYPKGPDGKSPVPETIDQYARDVAAFLMWSAEPSLEARKRTGFAVMIFLAVLASLLWYAKKKVWAKIGGEAEGLPGTAPLGPTG